jgi:hypothetical protein
VERVEKTMPCSNDSRAHAQPKSAETETSTPAITASDVSAK